MKGIAEKIIEKKIEEVVPYENNPRNNDTAVKFVANSIKQFGFKVPIIIDKNGVIVAGHTRLKAAKKLGMKMVPCIVADDLTPKQVKAFRLADNKTAELADWNDELLESELADIDDIDMGQFGFEGLENLGEEEKDDTYTTAINIPQYDITGDKTDMGGCYDSTKTDALVERIEASSVSDEEKEFLVKAAQRHTVFNYRKIAEYYAQASPEMQELMEESALVIIDYDNALRNGYVQLSESLEEIMQNAEG